MSKINNQAARKQQRSGHLLSVGRKGVKRKSALKLRMHIWRKRLRMRLIFTPLTQHNQLQSVEETPLRNNNHEEHVLWRRLQIGLVFMLIF